MNKFEIGKQPCSDFKPESQYEQMNYTHHCSLCGGERVFCENCFKDHHSDGWGTCIKAEKRGE